MSGVSAVKCRLLGLRSSVESSKVQGVRVVR